MRFRTIYHILESTAARHPAQIALHQPLHGKGETRYETYTWEEYRQAVAEIAVGLRELGLTKGEIVAIDSETRAEFYLADLGVMTAGGIAAALYHAYPAADQAKTIRRAGARFVMMEEPKSMAAFRAALPEGEPVQWILLTGVADGATTMTQLREKGRKAMAADPSLFDRILGEVGPEDYAILYMTSGATGEPKMGLVTQGANTANVEMAAQVLHLGPSDRTIAFLPSAHITQRLAMEILPLQYGMPVWFSESLSKMPHELKRIKPTFLVAPPRMWERFHTSIAAEIKKRPAWVQKLFWGALGAGMRAARMRQTRQSVPAWVSMSRNLGDRFFFRQVRERFGGELRLAISGSAPLSKDLATFYEAIGMPVVEGYGLTEGGITCLNPFDAVRIGSIGKALPGVQARIAEDGELLLKGDCLFSGYFNDPQATAQVLENGWLHTGDIGEIDDDGYVYITGRKKEVIVASNGKKIYPNRIEGLFKTESLINQVILIGDKLPFVSALFSVNPNIAVTLKGMEPFAGRASSEVMTAEPVQAEVKRIVARANKELAPFEQIRKFRLLDREFTMERGELTPTLKVRRSKVLENYRSTVNELYAGKEDAF